MPSLVLKYGFSLADRVDWLTIWLAETLSLRAPSAAKNFQNFYKDIFITSKDELILYPKEGKEHRTAYGARKKYKYKCDCPKEKLGDGKCDNNSQCNKFECFWDGHDCDDILPKSAYYIDKRASYHQRNRLKKSLGPSVFILDDRPFSSLWTGQKWS